MRGDIDEQHKIRMEAFEFKMQPIVINEEPSRKVSSIIIVHLLFIHFKRLSFITFRQITRFKVLSCSMISMLFV